MGRSQRAAQTVCDPGRVDIDLSSAFLPTNLRGAPRRIHPSAVALWYAAARTLLGRVPVGGSFLLILASVGCSVVGQLALKAGMGRVGPLDSGSVAQPLELAVRVLSQPLVLAGLACYVLGAVAWLGVLSRVPLSLAYPSLAMSYVLTALLAWLVLGEQVPMTRWLGIATICCGVVLVARA